jgi:hypothetical protein
MSVKTEVKVVLKNGKIYNFDFDGAYKLADYVKHNTVTINQIRFLTVKNLDDWTGYSKTVVNTEEVSVIEVEQV